MEADGIEPTTRACKAHILPLKLRPLSDLTLSALMFYICVGGFTTLKRGLKRRKYAFAKKTAISYGFSKTVAENSNFLKIA